MSFLFFKLPSTIQQLRQLNLNSSINFRSTPCEDNLLFIIADSKYLLIFSLLTPLTFILLSIFKKDFNPASLINQASPVSLQEYHNVFHMDEFSLLIFFMEQYAKLESNFLYKYASLQYISLTITHKCFISFCLHKIF